ncbi:MAG: BREX-1 system phosphatase PglZ type A [Spirochaetaceae bacterium]|nr:MAG: BREX-1 system phosphatase PglZ type A [Spirochaetaceae bacterium]
MYEKISRAVATHVKKHRLVFWYDPDGKHRAIFESISIDGSRIELSNNEWWVKHHVLKEAPDTHFLIYAPYPRPTDSENWLLDLVLAGFSFTHDLAETYREELGLGTEFQSLFASHVAFFQNVKERFEPLSAMIDPDKDTPDTLRVKMMAVLSLSRPTELRSTELFARVFFELAEDGFLEQTDRWKELEKFELAESFLTMLRLYIEEGRNNLKPHGAAVEIYKAAWKLELSGETTSHRRECSLLLNSWRDMFEADERYKRLTERVQESLAIHSDLEGLTIEGLTRLTLFPAIDTEIAHRLVQEASENRTDLRMIQTVANKRIGSYWIRRGLPVVEPIYRLLGSYAEFETELNAIDLKTEGPADISSHYVERLYRIDLLYRTCLMHYQHAGRIGSLAALIERIDRRYINDFLQRLSEIWDQEIRTGSPRFPESAPAQSRFFDAVVSPYLKRNEKLVVVVSDALRYEAGVDLASRLNGLNRVSAEAGCMIAAAPTITAVGMNALLPHSRIAFADKDSISVEVDGTSVSGIDGRSRWLETEVKRRFPGKTALAMWAHTLGDMPTDAARAHIGSADLVYLYSNGIDAVADNAKTETSLPEAVERELESITNLTRKIANQLNRSHILVTADHGFLYQNEAPEDYYFLSVEKPESGERERRFLLGATTPPGEHFYAADLSSIEIAGSRACSFVEGLYRIRKQGSGARFVHGGLSLQELLVPLLRVHVRKESDVKRVTVAIMKAPREVITTQTHTVHFYQQDAVSDKYLPETIRVFFAAGDGTPISDTKEVRFDSRDEDAQNRSQSVVLHFGSEANAYNGQTIYLEMQRDEGGAYVHYARESYPYRTFGERDF